MGALLPGGRLLLPGGLLLPPVAPAGGLLLRPARPAALRPPLPAGSGRVHPC